MSEETTESTYEDYVEDRTPKQIEEQQQGNMSLLKHLDELRTRLIRSFIAIGICSAISYFFVEDIVHFITAPAGKLYYMQPAEAFFTFLKVSLFSGFLMSLPVVVYNVWVFFLPALTPKEKATIGILVPASVLLFFTGITFSYYLVLPAGIKFFLGFANADLQPLLSIGKYLDFVVAFLLPFGFIFELPLVIMVLAKIGLVTSAFLRKQRRMLIFLSFVIGAVVSPTPDMFSQTMIAVPVILLYEISIIIVRFILRK
jgi:sec-independent protein translocase protein TatC